ncbi:response regulator [Vibrio sp. SCSIO 43137]|uniref:response regulator n=1 Tax=Vibrio sp. SCSIO 43137 TaxID=3021011 RepID=UPI002307F664|nr:response regulator [Vibrio sp. SCSIO 43137]WCE30392.1 response regulator [Vibrio sp. SCSIO 43137]
MTDKLSVMILEDDVRASYTLESTINQHPGFQVVAVSENCAEALMQYQLFKPRLIFVDITLPDGSGISVMRQLREQNAECDFIMTTAERETSTVQQTVQLGVVDYLIKPIRMSRVLQALTDYKEYTRQLTETDTVDQGEIDRLLRKAPQKTRATPKGIDATTLASLTEILKREQLNDFSASDIGERMNVSRITARRYLEFLESEGLIRLVLNYNTGGRPRRLYQQVN